MDIHGHAEGDTYVNDRIFQHHDRNPVHVDGALRRPGCIRASGVFQRPAASPLVKLEPRVVVAFVEIFENRRKDFGLVLGQINAFGRLKELRSAKLSKVRAVAKDVFVGGEESLLAADAERDDGAR